MMVETLNAGQPSLIHMSGVQSEQQDGEASPEFEGLELIQITMDKYLLAHHAIM